MKTSHKLASTLLVLLALCAPVGAAVDPLTGVNRLEVRNTQIELGRVPFILSYTSRYAASAGGNNLLGVTAPVSFGSLWGTTLHRRIYVSPDKKNAVVHAGSGRTYLFTGDGSGNFTPVAPQTNKLTTTASGYLFRLMSNGEYSEFDSTGYGKRIVSHDTSSVTLTYSGEYLTKASASNGRSIRFHYANGLIDHVMASDGTSIRAAYDAANNLVSLTWQDNAIRRFVYEDARHPALITGVIDELGVRVSTWTYDALGNVMAVTRPNDANNRSFTSDTPPRTSVNDTYDANTDTVYRRITQVAPTGLSVTAANGSASSISTVTVKGQTRLAGQTQSAASGCSASASALAYDANGNPSVKDDFTAMRTCFTYDSVRNLPVVSVTGLPTGADCAALLPANAALPTGAKKSLMKYDPDIDRVVRSEGALATTYTVLHGKPDVFPAGANSSCAPTSALPDGKAAFLVCKQVVQPTSNTNGGSSPTDPYYANVSFLSNGDGANGSKPTKDVSIYVNSIAMIRNAVVSTAQSKFGGASFYIPPSTDAGDAVWMAGDYSLAGDFTIEMWWYPTASPNSESAVLMGLGSGSGSNYFTAGPTAVMLANADGSYSRLERTSVPTIGQWNHLAFTRSGSTLTFYLNGTPQGSITKTGTLGNALGAYFGSSVRNAASYFDDVRITNGIARYSGAFTPPSAPFTTPGSAGAAMVTQFTYDAAGRVSTVKDALSRTTSYTYYSDTAFSSAYPPASYDPQFDKVSLLLHANGSDGSQYLLDDSKSNKAVIPVGNARISTAASKFGGASFYFDGSDAANTHVEVPADVDLHLPGAYTVEFWLNPSTHKTTAAFLYQQSNGGGSAGPLRIDMAADGTIYALGSSDNTNWLFTSGFKSTSPAPVGAWTHVAITDDGTTARLFVNGVLESSRATWTKQQSSYPLLIGGGALTVDRELHGYIDDFRVTKGLARYTANFTPPGQELLNGGPTPSPADLGHTVGDLQSITNAAGHVTQFTQYDRTGRVRQMIDPKGVVTDISYDARGRVSTVTTTAPGAVARTTSYTYDGAGQLTGLTQPDGSTLSYSYDAAHRLVGVIDAKGNSVSYTLDSTGNRIGEEIKDPGGVLQRSISRSYDVLNRLQQVTGAAR